MLLCILHGSRGNEAQKWAMNYKQNAVLLMCLTTSTRVSSVCNSWKLHTCCKFHAWLSLFVMLFFISLNSVWFLVHSVDLVFNPWEVTDDGQRRILTYTVSLNHAIGPKFSPTTEYQVSLEMIICHLPGVVFTSFRFPRILLELICMTNLIVVTF